MMKIAVFSLLFVSLVLEVYSQYEGKISNKTYTLFNLKCYKYFFEPFPNKPFFFTFLHYTSFPNKSLFFTFLHYTSFKNTVGNGEIARETSNFSVSHSVFYPFGEPSAIFIKFKIVVCKLFQSEKGSKLSFGKHLAFFNLLPAFHPHHDRLVDYILLLLLVWRFGIPTDMKASI